MEIYPTSSELPENLLKFYIHFSQPMSRGQAYRHIKLLKADGKAVDGAYLEIGEELWDASSTRFTLLLEPGRIKRGSSRARKTVPFWRRATSTHS